MGHAGSDPDPVPLNAFGHLGLQERRCHDVDALAEQFRERIAQVEEREDPTIVEINVHHEIDITVGPILTARRGSEDARVASPVRTNERADRTSLRLKRAKTRLRHIGSRCARLAPKYEAATGGTQHAIKRDDRWGARPGLIACDRRLRRAGPARKLDL